MTAGEATSRGPLRVDLWIAAAADEEGLIRGSLEVLQGCPQVHGVVFPEPTREIVLVSHRSFV